MSTARSSAQVERRRHQRFAVEGYAVLRCDARQYEGSIDNLSYTGMLLSYDGDMPAVGEECGFTLFLTAGQVQGRGRIARVDPDTEQIAVDLAHLDWNGYPGYRPGGGGGAGAVLTPFPAAAILPRSTGALIPAADSRRPRGDRRSQPAEVGSR
jgi:hypothetical protein